MKPIYEIIKIYHKDILNVLEGQDISPPLFEDLYIYYSEKNEIPSTSDVRNFIVGRIYIDCLPYWSTINSGNSATQLN